MVAIDGSRVLHFGIPGLHEAPGFPVLAKIIIQTVGDVGATIVPGFCRYKSNDSKTKSQGYLVFPFLGIPSI